jgi:uncharacterized protein (TIGR02594 family)
MGSFFAWLASLFGAPATAPAEMPQPQDPQRGDPVWLKLAKGELGTKEIAGAQHNPAVLRYFADAGFPEIDNDETAWCAAFANAMLQRSGYDGSKSLAARSFMNWGKPVAKPYPGCIAVLWRDSPRSANGHVAFWLSERGDKVKLLGGNQGNQVSMEEFPRDRVLGYREPTTLAKSRTVRASTAGIVASSVGGAALLGSQEQLMGVNSVLKDLGVSMPGLVAVCAILQIVVFAVIIWARADDLKTKGR